MRGRAAFCTVYRYHRLCPHAGRTEKYPFHRLRLCRRARDRTFWLRGRPRQIEASPHGTHCRGAFGLCRSHERQSTHRRSLRDPARHSARAFGEQNAVCRRGRPAQGHRLCAVRGERGRCARPLRKGTRDRSGDRNDKIPPRREGGCARDVRASTKEGSRCGGEGKRI